mmetsp:Transcript_18686/g.30973  ORF Transcript_18686/g.30973 Transcript_18686/m.30973 type:complete len:200 (-) Transcript_18686:84-683(-)|eukprot:CAMPEP_0119008100 /NCGR_PEP_ID=MMETSP1176-20130426/3464_1 /TAXON_ID=265551 /ORGANISM="Synedropsis recta cf, Strain CCMP1620" /LENGTH=199 /DNA_ID=CAMNT_0006960371 /DNA_START=26 /DNA_END=625 /DNA_ORIENTATION=-
MSSWDRSKSIPWSLVRQDGRDPDAYKEQVFKSLQKQMMNETRDDVESVSSAMDGSEQQQEEKSTIVPYSTGDMFKMAAFGGTIGSITGAVFGFMDSMRTAGESPVLQKASNQAKARYMMEGTTRSATIFGVFFGGFHLVKYGLRVAVNPGEWTEIGVAGAISMGALMSRPAFRPSMPYAGMLVVMDGVQIVMREWDKDK